MKKTSIHPPNVLHSLALALTLTVLVTPLCAQSTTFRCSGDLGAPSLGSAITGAGKIATSASSGQLSQIFLSGNEYFLVEHQTRSASYYDRGIPADGLLIWHVRRAEEGELAPWWDVDLECADGLWSDSGYPMGTASESQRGEDNLDFRAHDADYLERHAGNHGDATDPFDGDPFRRFSSVTNPAAVSSDGVNDVTIDQISGNANRMSFVVRNNPPDVERLARR